MKKRLVVVGGRGSGEIAMAVFEATNEVSEEWVIEGFLTDVLPPGERLGTQPVVGGTDEVEDFVARGYHVHYALHLNAKAKAERVAKLHSLAIPPEAHAGAVHPKAHIEPSAEIGRGVIVCAMAGTSFGVRIGDHVHCYSYSFIGHDSRIEPCVTVAAHSVVGGRVVAAEGSHIGLNATIREDVTIGEFAIVGMASVVLTDVAPYDIVVGAPAKVIRSLRSET